MSLTIRVNNTESVVTVGDLISDSGATAKVFALKDTEDFVFKQYKDPKFAKNMEPRLHHFINNPPTIEGGIEEAEVLGVKFHSLAWPKHIVYEKKRCVGFIMPRLSFENSVQLNRIFSVKNRKKEGVTEDINWRILVAKNLAAMYAALHKEKYFVIDTKPANLRAYRSFQGVSLLDCDGFKLTGSPYDGDMITKEYIAPESIGANPKKLGKGQDIFALSVLIFQIFNNGIHPYNGVPKTDEHLETQDRIKRGAYAYGTIVSDYQSPSPASLHHLFPERLLKMFDEIFANNKRPSASKWVELLESLRDPRSQKSCANLSHGKSFKKGCGACELAKVLVGTEEPKKPVDDPLPKSSKSLAKAPSFVPKSPPKKSNGMFWVLIILGSVIFISFLLDSDQNSKPTAQKVVSAPDNSPIKSGSSCFGSPSACTNEELCVFATSKQQWETGTRFQPHVNEANLRGLTCGISTKKPQSSRHIYLASNGKWEQLLTKDGREGCGFMQKHNANLYYKSQIRSYEDGGLAFELWKRESTIGGFDQKNITMKPDGKDGFDMPAKIFSDAVVFDNLNYLSNMFKVSNNITLSTSNLKVTVPLKGSANVIEYLQKYCNLE